MSKRAGLPIDFELSVSEADTNAPVDLDDYLDRELPVTPPNEAKPEPTPKVRQLPRPEVEPAPLPKQETPPPVRRFPRKELSLDVETERKAGDVVNDIREQGPQKDATASEFVRALVQLAHDVRHKADYSRLNRRGQWGSPTAKAFVADLKDVFIRAVGRFYIDRYPYEAREQLRELLPDGNPDE